MIITRWNFQYLLHYKNVGLLIYFHYILYKKIILNKNKINKFLTLLDDLYFRKYIIFSYDAIFSYKQHSPIQDTVFRIKIT